MDIEQGRRGILGIYVAVGCLCELSIFAISTAKFERVFVNSFVIVNSEVFNIIFRCVIGMCSSSIIIGVTFMAI